LFRSYSAHSLATDTGHSVAAALSKLRTPDELSKPGAETPRRLPELTFGALRNPGPHISSEADCYGGGANRHTVLTAEKQRRWGNLPSACFQFSAFRNRLVVAS